MQKGKDVVFRSLFNLRNWQLNLEYFPRNMVLIKGDHSDNGLSLRQNKNVLVILFFHRL